MVQLPPALLTEDDLPYSDDQPVDNELQLWIAILLRSILAFAWNDRMDWFLGINMGVYHDTSLPAIGPDAFLAIGVQRYKRDSGRLSYVIPRENEVVPQWVLEVVSKKPRSEYDEKLREYESLGVLYYTVYNPNHWRRDNHEPFETYRLENGRYVRQMGNPIWMPELGLGLGYARGTHEELEREWLYWYDEQGQRYPASEDIISREQELRSHLEEARLEAERARLEAEMARQESEQARQEAEVARQNAERQVEQERQQRSRAEQARQDAEMAQQDAEQQAEQERQQRSRAEQARQEAEQQAEQERQQRSRAEQQQRSLIIRLLTRQIGEIPEEWMAQLDRLTPSQWEVLGEVVLDFSGLADLVAWLSGQLFEDS